MSNGQGGGRKPAQQSDDRTLLDPLSRDELEALREARQRMAGKKAAASSPVAHQIVIGPDVGEDIGDAPTRAMPALPQFDGGVSLDQIHTTPPSGGPSVRFHDPASVPSGPAPSEPMSVYGTQGNAQRGAPPTPAGPQGPGTGPGFGENTLLWMQPPKLPPGVGQGSTGADVIPKATPKETAVRRLKTFGMVGLAAVIVGALLFATLSSSTRGVVELHTNPPKAQVRINGNISPEVTPVKLTLPTGTHEIEVALEGYKPHRFVAKIEGVETDERKEIDLEPISKPGLMTLAIEVQPVAARITVDGKSNPTKRSIMLPDLDPKVPHRILVEAPGYVKIEQEIPANSLKPSYNFVLQPDEDQKPR